MIADSEIEGLVIALLAVSRFSVSRARLLLPALRAAGLTSPKVVTGLDLGELTVALARTGYDRGLLTSLYAKRLQTFMQGVLDGELDAPIECLARNDRDTFLRLIRAVYGVGPSVAVNAWAILTGVAK